MGYRTTRPLALELNHGGAAAWGYPFVLPAGSWAILIPQLDGLTGDGFAAGDTKQLAQLSGNAHDAATRYTRIPANAVAGETTEEDAHVARLVAAEAERAQVAAWAIKPAGHYLQAFVIVLESGAVALAAVYALNPLDGETLARGHVLQLAGEGAAIWDCAAYPVGEAVRARGPLVEFLREADG